MFKKPTWKTEAEQEYRSIPNYWTLLEASRFLGYCKSTYLSQLALDNKIKSYKIGAYRLIDNEQLHILIDKKRK